MRTIYFRNLIKDFLKRWYIVLIICVLCAVICYMIGSSKKDPDPSGEEAEEVKSYEERVSTYEQAIIDAEEALKIGTEQVTEYQKYMDDSIYMRIDPQNVLTAQVIYSVTGTASDGNVINSLIAFVNDGGLKKDLDNAYSELDIKYWKEIIAIGASGNNINITVIHYDQTMLEKIVDIIKNRLQEQVQVVAATYANANIKEVDTTYYVKADPGITNTQNNNRNTMKGFINAKVDYENKVNSCKTTLENFKKNNVPEVIEEAAEADPKKYALFGIIAGLVLNAAVFVLYYMFSDLVKGVRDLEEAGEPVLGVYRKAGFIPSVERMALDLEMLDTNEVYVAGIKHTEVSDRTVEVLTELLKKSGIEAACGFDYYSDADQMRTMKKCANVIVVLECGRNKYKDVIEMKSLCEKFHIRLCGFVVTE